jgi:signal transduction histidine kinase
MHSISWRLVRWYALILALILLICGSAVFLSMRYLLFNEAAREVKAGLTTVKKIAVPEEKNLNVPELTTSIENGSLWVQITAPNGKILNSSSTLIGKSLAPGYVGPPVLYMFQGEKVFLAGAKLKGGTLVQIARPLHREEEFLEFLTKVLVLLIFAGLLLAAVGGWMITKAALNPIQQLIQTARSINTTDLALRIDLSGPHDELYQLALTFNQMLDRLEQGFQSQQEFLNAASHDLRTPLAVVKSYLDILNRWGKDDPAVIGESLPAITKAVGVMERLINDLLLLAKMQARLPLNLQPLSLPDLAEEIVREAQAVSLEISVLLKVLDPVVTAVDEYYLRRALWALVDNAIKYNHPGGEVTVNVFTNDNHEAVISVSDTGPGITANDLPRIFDRFYRGDPSRSQNKGFGLGLSLAKEIVEAHGGRIIVDSQPGVGSTFSIVLQSL